ncbi:MAG: MdlB, multidrug/protein/lipid transporter ATPase, ATP-binding cassette, subfamily bacterial [Candidatus Saccharibacteria bacterium]|nr:MdlB, multidrug/protein/lipid transporter ATPase, ATP-binding cassette, subfamily bacterial [Candidatus Saccharibacteria bacterium]
MQRKTIQLFWRAAMKYRYRTYAVLIGSVLSAVSAGFIGPFIISILLQQLQAGSLHLDQAWPLIILFATTQLYGEVIGWRLNLYFNWTMETAAMRDLYHQIFTALSEQSLTFHSNRFGGALVSQTTKFVGSFERFMDTLVFQFIPSVSGIAAAIIIMSFVFWQYAVFLIIIVTLFISIVAFGTKIMTIRNTEESQANTAVNATVADAITNIANIKAHGHETIELKRLADKTMFWRGKSLSTMRGFLFVSTGYSTLMAFLNTMALVAAIVASSQHTISIGVVYLAVTYTFTVSRQLWEMNSIMRNYNRVISDAHDMTEILLLEPEVTNHTTHQLKVHDGDIAFHNVTFTHDGNNDALFHNFNLQIKAGQRVGLVGHSGSGKTTLTRLLLRFSDVEDGEITIDNHNIAEFTQQSLRKNIAYVAQEPMLFHRTLSENIAYGKQSATQAEIVKAAKLAHALDFIEALPQGFDTLVGERGVKLSGGQRQRIAIARAILKDSPILVLDEATSALDSESEQLIQASLERLMKGRTSIVIAHRLSTIAKLDRIIVLEDGEVIEDGSHQELLKLNGIYARLWAHQSGGFIKE